jgi:hypothetical protein
VVSPLSGHRRQGFSQRNQDSGPEVSLAFIMERFLAITALDTHHAVMDSKVSCAGELIINMIV